MSRIRAAPVSRRMIGAGLFGALLITVVELVALANWRAGFVATVAILLLGLGLLCGLVMAAAELVVARFSLAALPAAMIRASGAIPPLTFASRHLFDGGQARSLPGASSAHLWVPIVGFLALAAALWLGQRLLSMRPSWRGAAALLMTGLVIVTELANRRLFRSEYADLHAFLIVVALVAAALAGLMVWTFWRPDPPAGDRRWASVAIAIVAAMIAVSFLVVLGQGFAAKRDRWATATRGCHARHLARVIRELVDFDGDGYSAVLGGGDCNDRDAAINPGVGDIPGNGRDEDCDGYDPPPPPPPPPPGANKSYAELLDEWLASKATRAFTSRVGEFNLILLLVDGLRADAIAPTPDNRRDYPHLFALIDESIGFRYTFAPSAGTDVSVGALLTGRYNPFVVLDTTIAEAISATGRVVHAVIPREVLRWAGKTLLTRGLTSHDALITDRRKRDVGSSSTSLDTTRLGLAFIDAHQAAATQRRFFLWLHYFDVHEHDQIENDDPRLRAALGPRGGADRADKYRATVKLVDDAIGVVLADLRTRQLWNQTIIVIAADHGEGLGEDPRLPDTHGRFIYNPLVHVPLFIRIPGVAPAAVKHPVSLIDLSPTLLHLVGAKLPSGLDGHTLLPYLVDAPAALTEESWPIVLRESEQHGIVRWPHKLLIRPKDNLVELYDLERDFGEHSDLSAAEPARVRELTQLYKGFPPMVIDRQRAALERREALAKPPQR